MRFELDMNNFQTLEIFTEKRVEMLRMISDEQPSSIRELARLVERDVKNVWEDLELLQRNMLIDLIENGRSKKPVVKHRTIVIQF